MTDKERRGENKERRAAIRDKRRRARLRKKSISFPLKVARLPPAPKTATQDMLRAVSGENEINAVLLPVGIMKGRGK